MRFKLFLGSITILSWFFTSYNYKWRSIYLFLIAKYINFNIIIPNYKPIKLILFSAVRQIITSKRQFTNSRRQQLDSETANGGGHDGEGMPSAAGNGGEGVMRIHENKLCELDSVEMERQTAIISYNTEAELSALQHKVAFLSLYFMDVWTGRH